MNCTSDNVVPLKVGSALDLESQLLDVDDGGAPIDLTAVDIFSQVRTKAGALVSDLVVTKDPDQTAPPGNRGKYRLFKDAGGADGTRTWPLERLHCDVLYVIAGVPTHTETFFIDVQRSETRAP